MLQQVFIIFRTMNQLEKTEKYYKTIQVGDLNLFDIFERAVVMFGYTKAGKTTAGHIFCNSILKAKQVNGEYRYEPTTALFKNAKIGDTTESETQIPNIFETKIKDPITQNIQKVWLLDQPGYGDTYGFHRIFSNGYFHYRTFSKTPKLKFILAINYNDLRGTAEKFKKTIINFVNAFADWEKVKPQILKATSFLITKVDVGVTLEHLSQIIEFLKDNYISNITVRQRSIYQEFISSILCAGRLFFIVSASTNNQLTPENNTLLQQIYDSCQFWCRPVTKRKVDMSQINLSVKQEIYQQLGKSDNKQFCQDFKFYINYVEKKTENIIMLHQGSLMNIINILQTDALKSNDNHRFIEAMNSFNQFYYSFNDDFKQKRKTIEANFFNLLNEEYIFEEIEENSEKLLKLMHSAYYIKIFKIMQCLQQFTHQWYIKQEINDYEFSKNVSNLQYISELFLGIFRKFELMMSQKTELKTIIYQYNYVFQRLIEEYKFITLIFFKDIDECDKIQNIVGWLFTGDTIFSLVRDRLFPTVLGEIQTQKIKYQFICSVDFDDLEVDSPEIIQFFQSAQKTPQWFWQRKVEMILKYKNLLFSKGKDPTESDKKYTISKLFFYRNKFYQQMTNQNQRVKQKITLVFNLTKALAHILQTLNLFSEARAFYQSINDAEGIFQTFDLQVAFLKKKEISQRWLFLQYSQTAEIYCRWQLALSCLQKAYFSSVNYVELEHVRSLIVQLRNKRKIWDECKYINNLQNGQLIKQLPKDLIHSLQSFLWQQ